MSRTKFLLSDGILLTLVSFYTYAVFSQLYNYPEFKQHIHNQLFSSSIANTLVWIIPVSEVLIILLLSIERVRFIGLCLSTILLFLGSGYIVLVLINYFNRIPCSCVGILSHQSWEVNLLFNLFFFIFSILGIGIRSTYSHSTAKELV